MRIEPETHGDRHRRLGRHRPRARPSQLAARGARVGAPRPPPRAARAAARPASREPGGRAPGAGRRRHQAAPGRARGRALRASAPAAWTSSFANAGIAHYGPFADVELELAEEMVRRQRARHHSTRSRRRSRRCSTAPAATSSSPPRAPALRAFPWAAVVRRHEGVRPRLRRGASPRALRHRRLGDDRLPRRGRDRPARTRARRGCPTGAATTRRCRPSRWRGAIAGRGRGRRAQRLRARRWFACSA